MTHEPERSAAVPAFVRLLSYSPFAFPFSSPVVCPELMQIVSRHAAEGHCYTAIRTPL